MHVFILLIIVIRKYILSEENDIGDLIWMEIYDVSLFSLFYNTSSVLKRQ